MLADKGCSLTRTRKIPEQNREGSYEERLREQGMVVSHWNRLPREAVDITSLEVFNARLDGALSNLLKW